MCQHLTVARIAEALAVSWDTANDAVLAEGHRELISDPTRFDGVQVIGVDEHCWRHTRASSAHRNARRDNLARGSAAFVVSCRHT